MADPNKDDLKKAPAPPATPNPPKPTATGGPIPMVKTPGKLVNPEPEAPKTFSDPYVPPRRVR